MLLQPVQQAVALSMRRLEDLMDNELLRKLHLTVGEFGIGAQEQ
jgi:hypothetical protein